MEIANAATSKSDKKYKAIIMRLYRCYPGHTFDANKPLPSAKSLQNTNYHSAFVDKVLVGYKILYTHN